MPRPDDILRQAAETFNGRNAVYDDNWVNVGRILKAMFPTGIVTNVETDFVRLYYLCQIAAKLTRYSHNFERGGRRDSIHDLCVYAAMLESYDATLKGKTEEPVYTLFPDGAVARIQRERDRQIHKEGWTAAHDDQHTDSSLMTVALMYHAHATNRRDPTLLNSDGTPHGWPSEWSRERWKPKNPVRDLERAGALVLAERDRLTRANPHAYHGHCDQVFTTIVNALNAELENSKGPADANAGGHA